MQDVLRALRRWLTRWFGPRFQGPSRDPFARVRVPLEPRPSPRRDAVAVLEPDDSKRREPGKLMAS